MSQDNEFKKQIFFTSNTAKTEQPFGLKFIEVSDKVVEQNLDKNGNPAPTSCPTGTARSTNTPRGTSADVDVDF